MLCRLQRPEYGKIIDFKHFVCFQSGNAWAVACQNSDMNFGLGTAQFGMKYGVTNSLGRVSFDEVVSVLALADKSGVRILDTAPSYGDSEGVLGRALPKNHSFQIVTKTPHFMRGESEANFIKRFLGTFSHSLDQLRQEKVYGLLVHGPDDLLRPFGGSLFDEIKQLKKSGCVQKIGVSVYDSSQIDKILERYDVDIIQLPLNVLDQRLIASGHLRALKKVGIEIHARSVFLQGVLLKPPDTLPKHFDCIKDHLRKYNEAIHSRGMSPVQAALAFMMNLNDVDVVLCGVSNCTKFLEILKNRQPVLNNDFFENFAITDHSILSPAQWKV